MPPVRPEQEAPTIEGFPTSRGRSSAFAFNFLGARGTVTSAGQGSINPNNINMQGLMALFALIGVGFVLAIIWFFFWAKNGGFVWKKGDWEEYKSTVLRRKGSDGKTLSNATAPTELGGGSIVGKGYKDDGFTVTDTTETATTALTHEGEEEEKPRRKRKRLKETAKQKMLRRQQDEKWEGAADEDVRAYRHEKPARVGGINREADGVYHGTDYTSTESPSTYETESNSRQDPPHYHNHHTRSVSGFSFTAGSEDVLSQVTEEHLLRDSTALVMHGHSERRRSRGDRSHSRQSSPRKRNGGGDRSPISYAEPLDFSSRPPESSPSESFYYQYSALGELDNGTGTKVYPHPIPGLSQGYRRDTRQGRSPTSGRSRRDSLSESDG